ncbi:MAG TPA: DUF2442 domain-containing protein, partial [Planctomycetota bacterium]|nr:DUF2442 domain-containing protein [Planctomycetota bacterium]
RSATALDGFRLRLVLTDGRTIERDVGGLLTGPIFSDIRTRRKAFEAVRVEGGTVVWPNGADLCPDVLIWDGTPPWAVAEGPIRRTRVRRPTVGTSSMRPKPDPVDRPRRRP